MSKPKRGRASPWIVFSALCFSALIALVAICVMFTNTASSVVPSPRGQPLVSDAVVEQGGELHLFPAVDWEYWQDVNPDIIAWVTVPGTSIDYAIVQAPNDDSTFYLYHDIYRNYTPYGCPYVDSDCEGLTSPSVYIFGHHMQAGSPMFADFAKFSDAGYAAEHPIIYLQTPDEQMVLDVSAAAIIRGSEASRRTAFEDTQELASWYACRYETAGMKVANNALSEQIITFVTCSYNYFSNERTLVYTQPQKGMPYDDQSTTL